MLNIRGDVVSFIYGLSGLNGQNGLNMYLEFLGDRASPVVCADGDVHNPSASGLRCEAGA